MPLMGSDCEPQVLLSKTAKLILFFLHMRDAAQLTFLHSNKMAKNVKDAGKERGTLYTGNVHDSKSKPVHPPWLVLQCVPRFFLHTDVMGYAG